MRSLLSTIEFTPQVLGLLIYWILVLWMMIVAFTASSLREYRIGVTSTLFVTFISVFSGNTLSNGPFSGAFVGAFAGMFSAACMGKYTKNTRSEVYLTDQILVGSTSIGLIMGLISTADQFHPLDIFPYLFYLAISAYIAPIIIQFSHTLTRR